MKARIKSTGNIVDVEWCGHDSMGSIYTDVTYTTKYYEYELDFDTVYDYWTRLKHQYAGMFLQAQISYGEQENLNVAEMIEDAIIYATSLIEKLKEEEK